MAADDAFPLPGVTAMSTIADWEKFFGTSAPSGVLSGVLSQLAPTLDSSGRQALMASGAAMLRGFHKPLPSQVGTDIPAPSAGDRIDRLVLRLNRSAVAAADFVKPTVIQGTSGVGTPPAIQSSLSAGGLWDLTISRWTSKASGALTGLVDERYWIGNLALFNSTAQAPLSPPRLGLQIDTLEMMWSDGVSWQVVGAIERTGYSTLTLSGSWIHGSVTLAASRTASIVNLIGSCSLAAAVTSGGSKIANLPAGIVPPKTTTIVAYQDGAILLLLTAYNSSDPTRASQLWLTGNTSGFAPGATVRINTSWSI